MGEVGISTGQFYYGLKWWEIRAIIEGYHKRERNLFVLLRWSRFMQMSTSMSDIRKAGIHKPEDLLPFYWEQPQGVANSGMSEEEIAEMQAEIEAYNNSMSRED